MLQIGAWCASLALTLVSMAQDGGVREKPAAPARAGDSFYTFHALPAETPLGKESQPKWPQFFFSPITEGMGGLNLVPLDEASRVHLKLTKGEGLLVASVSPQSLAAQAGVRQNDILLDLEEAPLSKVEDLEARLKAAGEKPLTLHLLHQGQKKELKIQPRVQATFGPVPTMAPGYWLGVNVGSLDSVLRSHLSVPEGQGLIVNAVTADGPAAKAGIKVNDILLKMGETPLSDQAALSAIVQKNGKKTALIELIREGSRQLVEVTPAERGRTFISEMRFRETPHVNFQLARPGAVLFPNQSMTDLQQDANGFQPVGGMTATNPVEKRLEALDGEVKELRKTIEELTKALKEKK